MGGMAGVHYATRFCFPISFVWISSEDWNVHVLPLWSSEGLRKVIPFGGDPNYLSIL